MRVYDHDNQDWFEAAGVDALGTWQRHCGTMFRGDDCPVCHQIGFYAKYVEVAFLPPPAITAEEMATEGDGAVDPTPAPVTRGRKPKAEEA